MLTLTLTLTMAGARSATLAVGDDYGVYSLRRLCVEALTLTMVVQDYSSEALIKLRKSRFKIQGLKVWM